MMPGSMKGCEYLVPDIAVHHSASQHIIEYTNNVYPGGPGPGTAPNYEMSIALHHIHFDGERPEICKIMMSLIPQNVTKRVVVFPLKLAQRVTVPGTPRCQ